MKISKSIFSIILIILLSVMAYSSKADTWTDPGWKEMIEKADVVALIRYTSFGTFKARAEIVKTYKGRVKPGEQIVIAGFSNRYGPIDRVYWGEQYIVFLNFDEPTEKRLTYLEEQVKERPSLKKYVRDVKSGKYYYVSSPTSGDLKVKNNNRVRYDLLQTTYYKKQNYYSLSEFESFLGYVLQGKASDNFIDSLVNKLKTKPFSEETSQALLMLYYLNYATYDPVFENLTSTANENVKYALARLMGNIRDVRARDLLVRLLYDSSSLVQGEAVRHLSKEPVEFAGPVLLTHLQTAGEEGLYPSLMNPVSNYVNGGKVEIIRALGKLDYQPAEKELLPLLDTENKQIFYLVLHTLNRLGSKAYVPYLNERLEKGNRKFIELVCDAIATNNLQECIPSLMRFIASHDKSIFPTLQGTISYSSGLARFKTDTVKAFLYQDFKQVLQMKDRGLINPKKIWIQAYVEVFTKLKFSQPKQDLYNHLYTYYGVNESFKNNPSLFHYKKQQEDSILQVVSKVLPSRMLNKVEITAFIGQDSIGLSKLTSYTIQFNFRNKLINANKWVRRLNDSGIPAENMAVPGRRNTRIFKAQKLPAFNEYLMFAFLDYVKALPDEQDIQFLENLKKFNYPKIDFENERLDRFIKEAKGSLPK